MQMSGVGATEIDMGLWRKTPGVEETEIRMGP